jgi:hypothetical protein
MSYFAYTGNIFEAVPVDSSDVFDPIFRLTIEIKRYIRRSSAVNSGVNDAISSATPHDIAASAS